jgi:isopenicillin-N epimerase
MDFFVRQLEPALTAARHRLAGFVGTATENLVFAENATYGMNVVARSMPLKSQDEVLLTDHEYGAVGRIWEQACAQAGGAEVRKAILPLPLESAEQVVDAIFSYVTQRTRLLVVSHVTSPTAVILPVAEICRRARAVGIAVCIDGPHAPAQIPLDIDSLDCDFYCASCHKWLSAPFGSGFLYVHPRRQPEVKPVLQSWGRLLPERPQTWDDEFLWTGTRDYTPYLTVPAAIDFLESVGMQLFRDRCHFLARYARKRLVELTGLDPIVPDSPKWYGNMAHVPLPKCHPVSVQQSLWQNHGIEAPIVDWGGRQFVRVSCHLYNTKQEIDRLANAIGQLIG